MELLSTREEVQNEVVEGRRLSLVDAVCLLIGNIVGSGIFISPRSVLVHSGSPSATLINWTLAGVIASIGSLW